MGFSPFLAILRAAANFMLVWIGSKPLFSCQHININLKKLAREKKIKLEDVT